jgi:hypothetical protein
MVQWGIAVAVGLGASVALAGDVPSLDQIKARLKQQRERIQSLYAETKTETTSPPGLDRLRQLPGFEMSISFPTTEAHFAFKGEKRYLRVLRPALTYDTRPAMKLPPNATPFDKAMHKQRIETQTRAKAFGPQPQGLMALPAQDETKACNGTTCWFRRPGMERKLPDGKAEKSPTLVSLYPPEQFSRLVTGPAGYLTAIGLALGAPTAASRRSGSEKPPDFNLLPDVLERGRYKVQDAIERVDAANCVVLSGTVERTASVGDITQKFTMEDKLWLDLDRGLALRKREHKTSPGPKTAYRRVNSSFEEVAPGVWLPKESELQTVAPSDDPDFPEQYRGKPVVSSRTKVTKWVVNEVPDDLFDPLVKPGDQVLDERGIAPPVER